MTQWGLDTLFNPAKRHMDEEKQRLEATREETGDSSGGRRIDLESGKVTIRRNEDDRAADDQAADEQAKGELGGPSGDDAAESKASPSARHRPRKKPVSDAQRRAALRRGLDPDRKSGSDAAE